MKRYIILTPSISNMGGSEMFTYNKYRYLSTHGWDVNVFYFNPPRGHFLLKDLEKYKDNFVRDLGYKYSFLSRRTREKVLNKILKNVNVGDEVVVESHLYNLAIWGELIASKIDGKSVLNCMEENIKQINFDESLFVEFKLKRHEILNATSKSLHRYFGNTYKNEYEKFAHSCQIYCSNVVTHSVASNINIEGADYNILSIGRLEKPYVVPNLIETRTFIQKHKDKSFNIIFIGGEPKGKEEENKIRNIFHCTTNVKLHFLGYMYPVPYNLISINDVAIASANSVLVASNEGVPTIVIDIHDNLPIGIYGKTTNSRFSRSTEVSVCLISLLDDILIQKKYPKTSPIISNEDEEMEKVFGEQVEFLNLSPNDKSYYDVMSIFRKQEILWPYIKYVVHSIIDKFTMKKYNHQ